MIQDVANNSTRKVQAVAGTAMVTPKATVARSVLRQTASAATLTPKDELDLSVDGLNNSIGWVPGVGTVINGLKLAVDTGSLVGAVVTFNAPQIGTELGNIVVDTIGLVPVVGAPLASLIYETVLGGNAKLGKWVRGDLQSYFDADSTWSKYKFQFDSVDVSPGIFGSHSGTATVSTPTHPGVSVEVDITNTGFKTSWSVPLQGRLELLALGFAS